MHDLTIVEEIFSRSSTAKDIGVEFDGSMSMAPHITAVCKFCCSTCAAYP